MSKAVDRNDITWFWVDDKAKLDGKGLVKSESIENLSLCSQNTNIYRLFQSLCGTSTFPRGTNVLWICLTVDREAIESMLRVYGPLVDRKSVV